MLNRAASASIDSSFDATVQYGPRLLQTLEDYTDVELDAKNERLGLENQLWAWDAHATRLLVVCPYMQKLYVCKLYCV